MANKMLIFFDVFVCSVNKKAYICTQILKHISEMIKPSEQTTQQIERFLKKIAQKFPSSDDTSLVTDIHVRVVQESGEMMAFDDDDNEITRCVVEQWIGNNDEDFYDSVEATLQAAIKALMASNSS